MTTLTFLDDVTVELIRHMGDDDSVVQAAQVSVTGENEADLTEERKAGLINYLLREKHGSPFEHNAMTFYVKAPIFVFREFQRHRIGFSYNEMSGRYTKLLPEFYMPGANRPLVNIGKNSKPEFAEGSTEQALAVGDSLQELYTHAWSQYEHLLDQGIGNEVARVVLPVGIYSQMYVTLNARSMMSFLTLRTQDERATHLSRPQYEIDVLTARKMEATFAKLFPVTYDSYNANGRVAP